MGTENTSLNTAITVADEQISSPLSFQVERVSVASDGTEGNNSAFEPAISADGRFVTYSSQASNLVVGDTNGTEDIFVFDRQTNTTERVSVASDGTEGNSGSLEPAISADGRFVTYSSRASNLVSGDTNGTSDVFVLDRRPILSSASRSPATALKRTTPAFIQRFRRMAAM
jgi:uncharacterized membrane protein